MSELIKRFMGDQSGATAIEYALIASAIFLVIVSSVTSVGSSLNETFTTVNTGFSAH